MAEIRAFRALRFSEQAGKPEQLTCPPYDVISDAEREEYLRANPHNIVRLELPRGGEDPYAQAGELLALWQHEGYLRCDDEPGLYVYEEEFTVPGGQEVKRLKGFLCRVRVEEWEKGVVLPHEETLSKAKADRLNLLKATGCSFSAIYSLYSDQEREILPRIEEASSGAPEMEFRGADGILHRLWRVTDPGRIEAITSRFADRPLYIADGHHRYETAINYRNHLKEQGVVTDGEHPANFAMMMLVNIENPGLVVLPTHRIVRGLADFDAETLLENCEQYFEITDCPRELADQRLREYAENRRTAFAFVYAQGVRLLVLRDESVMDTLLEGGSGAYRHLDVNTLHTLVLERLLGIDKENMANQKNLIYTRDVAKAFDDVRDGRANCAFLLNATRIDEIADIAGAGEKMPQKSTYFYPKVITGHVMNKMLDAGQ